MDFYFACKPTKCAFRNERDERLAIAIEAWDLRASKPMAVMGLKGFTEI